MASLLLEERGHLGRVVLDDVDGKPARQTRQNPRDDLESPLAIRARRGSPARA
jgi:hypothetical protein